MASKHIYGQYSVQGKSINELSNDKVLIENEVKLLKEFMGNEAGKPGTTATWAFANAELLALNTDLTAINTEITRLNSIRSPDEETAAINYALQRNQQARERLLRQEQQANASPHKNRGETQDFYTEYRRLNEADRNLRERLAEIRERNLDKKMDALDKDWNNNIAQFDRSNDNELKRAEGLAQKWTQFKCLRDGTKYDEWQCRYESNTATIRCPHTFVSKANRDKHESNYHRGQNFFYS